MPQTAAEAERAKTATLPPLQSVMDLTSAAAPPTRNMEEMATSVSSAGAPSPPPPPPKHKP